MAETPRFTLRLGEQLRADVDTLRKIDGRRSLAAQVDAILREEVKRRRAEIASHRSQSQRSS